MDSDSDSDDDFDDSGTVNLCDVFWKLLYSSTGIDPLEKAGPAPE